MVYVRIFSMRLNKIIFISASKSHSIISMKSPKTCTKSTSTKVSRQRRNSTSNTNHKSLKLHISTPAHKVDISFLSEECDSHASTSHQSTEPGVKFVVLIRPIRLTPHSLCKDSCCNNPTQSTGNTKKYHSLFDQLSGEEIPQPYFGDLLQ